MFDSVHGHQFFITERKKNLEVISGKKSIINHIEIAEEIFLKILVIRGLLLVCIDQDNTCLLGLKGLKIPRQV